MSKKHLTLADLKKQGLKLSKSDAQELHHHVSRIAQHGSDEDIVFDGEETDQAPASSKKSKKETPAATESQDNAGDVNPDDVNPDDDLNDNPEDTGFKFSLPIDGEHHATKKKRQKEANLVDHIVTQEDLDNNPELVEAGIKVDDLIEIPLPPTE